jgi:hypothetical protein
MRIPEPLRLVLLALAGLYAIAFVVSVATGAWTPDQVAVPTAIAALFVLVGIWPRRPEVVAARIERRSS